MQAMDFFSGLSSQSVAIGAMGLCYVLLFSEKLNRAVITVMLGAVLAMLGVVSQKEALAAIDFNTLSLLAGMMIIINVAERSGMFQYVAIWGAKKVRANPLGILMVLGAVTAVFSAFLDNVTTVLLIVPVSLQITQKLEVNPYPYLLMNIFASNIGGTATLIGDPPNILIGSALGLSFTDFLFHLAPVVLVIMLCLALMFAYFWGDSLKASLANRALVMNINEKDAISDFSLLYKALFVLFFVIGMFGVAEHIGLENGFIALLGAAVMLLLYTFHLPHKEGDDKVEDILNKVDWTTIFFFAGLFVIVGALETSGVLHKVGAFLAKTADGSIQKSVFLILSVSAVFSAVVDNIPFVATMIPTLKAMEESLGGREAMMPVWWALSLGACLGGNGTLIGASANVIVAGIAAREGRAISFVRFLIWSVPVTVMSVLIAGVFLYLEYFL
ncbi:MAG: ArsB/NhaD family transporter [Alphaproteobacteria bacterium]|nr:ArsB/NhaD family transporter [Alphaproteobacteria bacterium]